MGTQTIDVEGGGISGFLARYRSHIAAVVAVVTVAVLLFVLDSVAVPLNADVTMRVAGSGSVAGGEAVYNQYAGLWLWVRGIMGAYILFVAIFISVLVVTTWMEVVE